MYNKKEPTTNYPTLVANSFGDGLGNNNQQELVKN